MRALLTGLLLGSMFLEGHVSATCDELVASTAELRQALLGAKPGARIRVAPGEYEGLHVADIHGTEVAPIVVVAADPKRRPVFRGAVHLSDVSWLELVDLTITGAKGNGLNLDDGGTFATPTHHVTLRGLHVHDTGAMGNEDGIKLSGLVDFTLTQCRIERWGRGGSGIDMVGCRRGVVQECTLVDREVGSASSGIQMKGGSEAIEVRACHFEHAGDRALNLGGSTGLAFFRPKPAGFEARALRVVDCTFVGSQAPIAFVGCEDVSVEHNTFVRPRKWLARILQETRAEGFVPCRKGRFVDNLVVYRREEMAVAVNVGPGTEPGTFEFARNYWFCADAPQHSVPQLPCAQKDAVGGKDPGFVDEGKGDLRLGRGSPAAGYGRRDTR